MTNKITLNSNDLLLDSSNLKIANPELAKAIQNGVPELQNDLKKHINSFDLSKIRVNDNGEVEILNEQLKDDILSKFNPETGFLDINVYKCG